MLTTDQNKIFKQNINLAYFVVNKWAGKLPVNVHRDDILQEALIGLAKAITTHDSSRGKLSTYSVMCMQGRILNYIRDQTHLVKGRRIQGKTNREPIHYYFLDKPQYFAETEDCCSRYDVLQSNYYVPNIELKNAIDNLGEELSLLVKLVVQGYTQKEIAKATGKSVMCINRHYLRAVNKLKTTLLEETIK